MAEPYVGARKEIAFSKESTRGTAEDYSNGDWQPHDGVDFGPMVDKVRDERSLGRIEDINHSAVIQESSEGNVNLYLTKSFAGHIINMITGKAPSTSGPSGSIYTHTWSGIQNDNQHQSYTLHIKDNIKGFLKYPLVMLNQAVFNFAVDAIPNVQLGLMGGKEAAGTPGTPAYDTTYETDFFLPQHMEVYFADAVTGLDAADEIALQSAQITFSKNTAKEYALGQTSPVDVVNQLFGVGIQIEQTYENTMLRDWAHTNTHKAMRLVMDDGNGTVLTIDFGKVGFEDWNDSDDRAAYQTNSIAIFGERDNSDGMLNSITLANEISSY